jgi:hypothetical protein
VHAAFPLLFIQRQIWINGHDVLTIALIQDSASDLANENR